MIPENRVQLSGGVPTVAFRDLEIQRRENDLVGATFGRGFYILDDYTPLRYSTPDVLAAEAALFPVKDAWMYIESSPMGGGEKASQGHDFFTAPNPLYGAVFTYHLREGLQSRTLARRETERQAIAQGQPVSYPSWDSLRVEDRDEGPAVVFTVTDQEGNVVRRLTGPTRAGMHRVAWDLRYAALSPTRLGNAPSGPMVVPGSYTVSMAKRVDGILTRVGETQTFEARPLGVGTLPAADRAAMLAFQQRVGELQRAVMGANEVLQQSLEQLAFVKQALRDARGSNEPLGQQAQDIERRMLDLQVELNGDQTIRSRAERIPPSIVQRVQRVVRAYVRSTSTATTTHERNYDIAAAEFEPVLARLGALINSDLAQLYEAMEAAGMPWTPGRGVPRWRR